MAKKKKTCMDTLTDDIKACARQYPVPPRGKPDPNKELRKDCISDAMEKYWKCQLDPIFRPRGKSVTIA